MFIPTDDYRADYMLVNDGDTITVLSGFQDNYDWNFWKQSTGRVAAVENLMGVGMPEQIPELHKLAHLLGEGRHHINKV